MRQDLVFAVRSLRKTPGFLIPAVITLALGIGANSTVLTLADAVLRRPLPVPEPDRLVHVYQSRAGQPPQPYPLSFADYLELRGARSFESLAAHYPTSPMHVLIENEPASITGAVVTANYFDTLKLRPARGRFFASEDDRVRDRDAVAIVSHDFWQRRLAGDALVAGRELRINGRAFTIIGVAPERFSGVHPRGIDTDVWIPSAMFAIGYRYCDAFARGCTIVELLGRLAPGVTAPEAQRELDVLARGLEMTYPASNRGLGVRVVEARGVGYGARPDETRQLTLFVAVTGVVLLIACANIAGLLLARATARRKEMAMRLALGAGRARITRQLLTECLVLAALAGALGLVVASWGNALLETVFARDSAGRPVDFSLPLSPLIVGATAAISTLAAVVFGLAPSIAASRADVMSVLKDETASGGARRSRLRPLLVTGQIALTVMLLVSGALLLQSVQQLLRGPGFDPSPLIMLRLRPSLIDYSRERAHAYQRQVIERLEGVPGVTSASPSVFVTLVGAGVRATVSSSSGRDPFEAIVGHGGARYFETMGLPLIEGRDFAATDDVRAPLVTVVNDRLAGQMWPGAPAVGQTLAIDGVPHAVVGVVPDAQYYAAGETPRPQAFVSYWQPHSADAFLNDARTFVRVSGSAAQLMPAIRRAVAEVDPDVPLSEDYPLRERVEYLYQPVRLARTVLVGFAALAVLLSAVGLYGVLAFTVVQRRREIGVRMALGANPTRITGLVVREGATVTVTGVLVGIAGAWASGQLLSSLLYGVDARNSPAFVAATTIAGAAAAVATLIPARRAARVPPAIALRCD